MEGITRHSKIKALVVIALVIWILGCNKEDKGVEHPEPPTLGETFQGGIVFYIDGTGKHGLIAAASDLSINTPWWNGTHMITGANSTTDGSANTTKIINAHGNTGSYAAKLCRDYRGGTYSDWFLPSKDQLNILYTQKTLVGGFRADYYWSSSEFDYGEAWVQYFLDGTQGLDNTSDGAIICTRAIRAY